MSVGSELGITEEDLEGLGLGDLSWDQPPAASTLPAPAEAPREAPAEASMQMTSGDLLVDRLIALGHEQGYVDISDIIAAFEDPEGEAERIEEIGRRLHEARIEIRDGDEVIDMDAEYAEEEAEEPSAQADEGLADLPAALPREDEPAMTPFSLTDLGLSEDEIAALGLGEAAGTPPEPERGPAVTAEEPAMTPFSLADLGLSEDEIAGLGAAEAPVAPIVEEPAAPEPEPAPTPVAPPEPEPVAAVPMAPPARPATGRMADEPPSSSGNDMLDAYVRRLEADPQNHMLRLSVARAGGQLGNPDFSIQQYRYLIKHNALLDMIVDDIQDLIADADERQLLKRLHRTLGDIYTKQGRLNEAMDEYSWTPAGS